MIESYPVHRQRFPTNPRRTAAASIFSPSDVPNNPGALTSSSGTPGEDRGGGIRSMRRPPPCPSPGVPEEGENGCFTSDVDSPGFLGAPFPSRIKSYSAIMNPGVQNPHCAPWHLTIDA